MEFFLQDGFVGKLRRSMMILAELWETEMKKRRAERTDHLSVGFLNWFVPNVGSLWFVV